MAFGGMNNSGGFGAPGGGRPGGNGGGSSSNSGGNSSGGKSSGNAGGNTGNAGASGKGASAAGTSSTSSSRNDNAGGMQGALSAGPSSNSGNRGGNGGGASSNATSGNANSGKAAANAANATGATNAAAGSVMGGLKSAVDSARSERNSLSQSSIKGAVDSAFGRSGGDTSSPNAGVTAPNATPAQKDAYSKGYRDEANAGMTRTAFGVVPGVGSLAGEAVARSQTMTPGGMPAEVASAYGTGRTGAKDAGISTGVKGVGTALGTLLGGPIAGMLANAVMGTMSYNMQREANPQAFSGAAPSYSGPVSGSGETIGGAAGTGGGSYNAEGMPTMASSLSVNDVYGGAPTDYSDMYNSYHNMNLGGFNG